MKCEHCGNNEVNFVFQSNINGKLDEKHLCHACAEKLGYAKQLQAHYAGMDSLFRRRFAPMRSPMGLRSGGDAASFDSFFGGSLLSDGFFDDFFAFPRLVSESAQTAQAATEQVQQQEELVPPEEQTQLRRQRTCNALRSELQQAVAQEHFERAAELRDQIRAMESRGGSD